MNILPQPSLERYLFGKLILQLGFGFFRYIVLLLSHTLYAGITRRCRWSRSWGTSPSPSSPPPTWPWSTQTCSGFSGILSLALDHSNEDPSQNEKGGNLFSKIVVLQVLSTALLSPARSRRQALVESLRVARQGRPYQISLLCSFTFVIDIHRY